MFNNTKENSYWLIQTTSCMQAERKNINKEKIKKNKKREKLKCSRKKQK